MNQFESNPCGDCDHRAVGTHTTRKDLSSYIAWDPPPPDCGCDCHWAWRFLHGKPAEVAA